MITLILFLVPLVVLAFVVILCEWLLEQVVPDPDRSQHKSIGAETTSVAVPTTEVEVTSWTTK